MAAALPSAVKRCDSGLLVVGEAEHDGGDDTDQQTAGLMKVQPRHRRHADPDRERHGNAGAARVWISSWQDSGMRRRGNLCGLQP